MHIRKNTPLLANKFSSLSSVSRELSILWQLLLSLGTLFIRKIGEITALLTKEIWWSGHELTQGCHFKSNRQSWNWDGKAISATVSSTEKGSVLLWLGTQGSVMVEVLPLWHSGTWFPFFFLLRWGCIFPQEGADKLLLRIVNAFLSPGQMEIPKVSWIDSATRIHGHTFTIVYNHKVIKAPNLYFHTK